eukprot:TRINITY_DN3980_c0_g1_i1.p1 TRINITY_DN3980_c0_g1~~TRINITY_DN3980_c0_g1_i1.p1  ORF type:complete len:285 (+),score=56.29 TRINITY_DN3980_c0_g1_i1:65-919(+)
MKHTFKVGDIVYCLDNNVMYKAKILDTSEQQDDGQLLPIYHVTFYGFNKSHNQWVFESQVSHIDEETTALAKKLVEQASRKSKRSSKRRGRSAEKPSKKPKTLGTVETDDDYRNTMEVRIDIPTSLKQRLVEEHDCINKKHKIWQLPAKVTVCDVVNQYVTAAGRLRSRKVMGELGDGVKAYFQEALPNVLLYDFERGQLDVLQSEQEDIDYTKVYGADHLIRLMVKMPALLALTNLDARCMRSLVILLEDLMRHMEKHADKFFVNTYQDTSEDFRKIAKAKAK